VPLSAEEENLTRLQKEKAAKEAEKLAAFRERFVEAFKAEDSAHWLAEFQSYAIYVQEGCSLLKQGWMG
jgi:hypothetical protein